MLHLRLVIFCLLWIFCLDAQKLEGSFCLDAQEVRGVVLLDANEPFFTAEECLEVDRIQTKSLRLPTKPVELARLLSPYFNKPLTEEMLEKIKSTLILYFETHGQFLSVVSFPDQRIADQVIQVRIFRANLREIFTKGLGQLPKNIDWTIDGIALVDESGAPLASDTSLIERMAPHFHTRLTNEKLEEIQALVKDHFESKGEPLTSVSFPDQQVLSSTVQIQIVRAKLGEMFAEGLGQLPQDLYWMIDGIALVGENGEPLASDTSLIERMAPHFHTRLTNEKLEEIQAIVKDHFESKGEPLTSVSFPDQQVLSSTVQIQIVHATLGEIYLNGLADFPQNADWKMEKIVLLDEEGGILPFNELVHLNGVYAPNISLPTEFSTLEETLAPYLHQKLTDESLQNLKTAIEIYFRSHGQPLSVVTIPDQQVVANSVQVQIKRPALAEIFSQNLGSLPEDLDWRIDTVVLLDEQNQILTPNPSLQDLLRPHLHEKMTEAKLEEIRQTVESYYASDSSPLLFLVEIPDQQITTPSLQVQVKRATLATLFSHGLDSLPSHLCWKVGAIVLLEADESVLSPDELTGVLGLQTKSVVLPDGGKELEKQLSPYLNTTLTNEKLQEIQQVIGAYFKASGEPLSVVVFPDQQVACQAIQVQLIRAPIGRSFAENIDRLPLLIAANEVPDPNWQIHGVVILGDDEELLPPLELSKVIGVKTDCFRLPTSRQTLQNQLEPYFSDPLNQETLENIRTELYRYFQKNDEPFVVITVPDQTVESKVIQVQILRAKLGQVYYEGTHSPIYRNAISTQSGEELYPVRLQGDLEWLNRYPFRKVDLIYESGREPGTTDIILCVREEKPWRIYLGTDNTGVRSLGRERAFAGFSVGLPNGYFTCQYTSSYHWNRLQAITAQYIAYLPSRHLLNLYGGYSIVHASLPFPEQKSSGHSADASLRYEIPFTPVASMQHQLSLGGDFKSTDNTLEFSEIYERYFQLVNLTQLTLGYQGSWQKNRSRIDFLFNLFGSPGGWLPDMTDADYNSLRPGATNQWIYGRGVFRYLQKTTLGFSTELDIRFQASSGNLIPSEQIGIGGSETVRGYDERQLNYDQGIIGNFEIRTPPIALISSLRGRKVKDSIQFLVFFDYGIGTNYELIPGEANHEYLMGVGPGVRYTLDPWIAFRLDWGFKLHQKPGFTGGPSMLHFGLTGSF
jgi:hemolysin activation/secretion protein